MTGRRDGIRPYCRANHVIGFMFARRLAAMWRFLHRQRSTLNYPRCGAKPFSWLAAIFIVVFAGLIPDAQAQEEQLSKTGHAGQPILIREHAGWNKDCDGVAPPPIYLFSRPRHGNVCIRVDQIKISSMYTGTQDQCIGQMVRGVGLIYQSESDFAGDDVLLYAVQYPSVLRKISVKVSVAGYQTQTLIGTPRHTGALPSQMLRTPELVPVCPELLF